MTFTVAIGVPPSLNNAYVTRIIARNKPIRVLSAEARAYKKSTARDISVMIPKSMTIVGSYDVHLALPVKMRGDADNRLKLALDALVMSGRVPDDAKVRRVTAEKCLTVNDGPAPHAQLTVTPALAYALAEEAA